MTKGEELLPCPSCESDIVAVGLLAEPSIVNGHQACCGSCGACGPERPNERAATESWNAMPRATALSSAQERIAELEGMVERAFRDGLAYGNTVVRARGVTFEAYANEAWDYSSVNALRRRSRTTEKMDG